MLRNWLHREVLVVAYFVKEGTGYVPGAVAYGSR